MAIQIISLYQHSGIFYCPHKNEIGKNSMTTRTNYVIFNAKLRIEKQMWFKFCLYVLFIWHMPQFNRRRSRHICIIELVIRHKHETRCTEINIMEITRSKQQTEVALVPCVITYICRRQKWLLMSYRWIHPALLILRTKL